MGRKRQSRRDLPERVYRKYGAYYFVDMDMFGKTLSDALKVYGERMEPKNIVTMGQVLDRFMAEIVPGIKKNTAKSFKVAIPRLKNVFENTNPQSIRSKDIYKYRDIRERKNGKSQAKDEVSKLSTILSKAVEWGIVERNYCKEVRGYTIKERERYMTDEEYDKLYQTATP